MIHHTLKTSEDKPIFIIIDSMVKYNKYEFLKYSTKYMHYKFDYINPYLLHFHINCYQNLPKENELYQKFHEFDDYTLLIIYKWLKTISDDIIVFSNDKYRTPMENFPDFFIPIEKIEPNIDNLSDYKYNDYINDFINKKNIKDTETNNVTNRKKIKNKIKTIYRGIRLL
jgi:hypothetical protein